MKLTIAAVISKDGYLTRGNDPNPGSWSSEADKKFLTTLLKKFKLQVMGARTYDIFKPKPEQNVLRVVLTTNPDDYRDQMVAGQLEFKNLTPEEFVKLYAKDYEACLILGGSHIYSQFIDANLVDEMYITIEPVNNVTGVPFLPKGRQLADLSLHSPVVTKLNNEGTELYHYDIKN